MARKAAKPTADEALVEEAHREFKECEDRESHTRPLWKADLRFANGDPENGYQWDEQLRKQREIEKRPCLTTNKVKQHNRQITNDARQNKPAIRVYPVDGGADKKTAEVFNGIIRHIEAASNADTAYDIAGEFAVDAGLGYWRVTTDYAADDSFDQEIYIKSVPNPLNVYLGRHTEPDGSDAKRGFIFEDMPKEEFEAKYPDCEAIGWPTDAGSDWLTKDTIRVAEYFKIVEEADTLCAGPDGKTFKLSEIEDPIQQKAVKADESIQKRKVSVKKCKWYLIAGDQIVDRRDWLGKYIPIVRVVGEEVEIDGKIDRKGHTRALKDAQRMYNYWSSAGVEYGALQGKQPYLAPAEGIAGYEKYWDNLNTSNLPYLPYNALDAQGQQIPMPQRQMPPVTAPMYMEGMRVASEEMKMASGQYDAAMGKQSNETSGRAIMARQHESDNATFHFIDNVARAIRYTGKILVDLIPKVYDTARVVRILGEDGKDDIAHINPELKESVVQEKDLSGAIKEIYNPGVGRFDVTVSVGPSYGTKRQEAFQALTEMSSRNPQLMGVAGDLIMKAADFPMADQIAERLEKTLPPGLADPKDGQQPIPPEVQQQMQQKDEQIQAMGQALNEASRQVDELEAKANSKESEVQAKAELARQEAEHRARLASQAADDARKQALLDADVEIEKARIANEAKLDIAAMDQVTKLQIAAMQPAPAPMGEEEAQPEAPLPEVPAPDPELMAKAMDRIGAAMEMMARPKKAVRDSKGVLIGVE